MCRHSRARSLRLDVADALSLCSDDALSPRARPLRHPCPRRHPLPRRPRRLLRAVARPEHVRSLPGRGGRLQGWRLHQHQVARGFRGLRDAEKAMNQKGCVLWFTGFSGSGKSTVAYTLEHALFQKGKIAQVLDGDNIRHGLNSNVDFSPEGREENIRRIGEVSKLFADSGMITLVSFISPYRADRDRVRERVGDKFVEVYMKIPLAVCEERDPKGLYKAARAGKIKGFTGIDDPYEEPLDAEIVMEVAKEGGDGLAPPRRWPPPSIEVLEQKGYLSAWRRATRERDLEEPSRASPRRSETAAASATSVGDARDAGDVADACVVFHLYLTNNLWNLAKKSRLLLKCAFLAFIGATPRPPHRVSGARPLRAPSPASTAPSPPRARLHRGRDLRPRSSAALAPTPAASASARAVRPSTSCASGITSRALAALCPGSAAAASGSGSRGRARTHRLTHSSVHLDVLAAVGDGAPVPLIGSAPSAPAKSILDRFGREVIELPSPGTEVRLGFCPAIGPKRSCARSPEAASRISTRASAPLQHHHRLVPDRVVGVLQHELSTNTIVQTSTDPAGAVEERGSFVMSHTNGDGDAVALRSRRRARRAARGEVHRCAWRSGAAATRRRCRRPLQC